VTARRQADDGRGRFIAGRFNSENTHRRSILALT
jgi:hypothetical protein